MDNNTRNIFGSCKNGDLEEIKNLIDNGAVLASSYGRLEIIKFLVEKGANVEAKNVYGETPLLVAS